MQTQYGHASHCVSGDGTNWIPEASSIVQHLVPPALRTSPAVGTVDRPTSGTSGTTSTVQLSSGKRVTLHRETVLEKLLYGGTYQLANCGL
jgi:hypothetical protein